MKKTTKHLFGLFGAIICSFSFLAGCSSKNNSGVPSNWDPNNEELVTHILEQADPNVTVSNAPFESMITGNREDLPEDVKLSSTSCIFDMPRNDAVYLTYDSSKNNTLQSSNVVLGNIVEANNQINLINVVDRKGESQKNLLATDGQKISIAAPGGFEYGEVYQIELDEQVPYLSFEGRDSSIRKLTIEIEDNPNEAATYDDVKLKNNIKTIDRSKVTNKQKDEKKNLLSFDYSGYFPMLELDDIFYATIEGKPNEQLDFYGKFFYKMNNDDGTMKIVYKAPDATEIFETYRQKGVTDINLDDAEYLLTSDLAKSYFKESAFARGLVKTLMYINPDNVEIILKIIKALTVHIDTQYKNNRLHSKFSVTVSGFKLGDGAYLTIDFGKETITEYTMDFDVSVHYDWFVPTGVDYKFKCIEDTQEAYYLKFVVAISLTEEIPSDETLTEKLLDNIDKSVRGQSSEIDMIRTPDECKPSSGGTRTTWPLLAVDFHGLAPFQIRLKLDFYMDFGFNISGLVKYETRSKKVDFNFTNVDGTGQDSFVSPEEGSNVLAYIAGDLHFEIGIRLSLGLSLAGLYDYLHAEAYAEAYIGISISGMIAANFYITDSWSTKDEFTGYICIDLAFYAGVRAGVHFKALIFERDYSIAKSVYLMRVKYENAMSHWCDDSPEAVDMNTESLSINDTNLLHVRVFDSVTWTMRDQYYKPDDKYEIFSGLLIGNGAKELLSGNIFEFTPLDNRITVSQDGMIKVKDGTAAQFDGQFKIHVNKYCGCISDKIVTVHYTASDVKDVYCDDKLIGQARPGTTITLPKAPEIYGKRFEYYEYPGHDNQYHEGDKLEIGNESITLIPHYSDLKKYIVRFMDADRHLLAIDEVYEGYNATAPSAAMRDRYMPEGYVFIGWDKSLTNITKTTNAYAVYMKVE